MLYSLLVAPDTAAIIGMTPTVSITIIHMGTMVLRMGIKATVIVVDGNTINGHADQKEGSEKNEKIVLAS